MEADTQNAAFPEILRSRNRWKNWLDISNLYRGDKGGHGVEAKISAQPNQSARRSGYRTLLKFLCR